MLTVGSLFSGIGGIDLGLERAGMKVVWQVEIDPWCQRVLAKHWPDVERFADVREVGAHNLAGVDVIAGGFPCQDISLAGRGAGLSGEQSGLWFEFARIVRELRPRYVFVENVAGLLVRGADRVLADLAACGYDAEWDCIPAAAIGAPHLRNRFWLVAYPGGSRRWEDTGGTPGNEGSNEGRATFDDHLANGDGQGGRAGPVADTARVGRRSGRPRRPGGSRERPQLQAPALADANGIATDWPSITWPERGPWATEPNVGRVAHGIPARVDRLRGLGNAVVPQVVEWIGRRIVEAEGEVAA